MNSQRGNFNTKRALKMPKKTVHRSVIEIYKDIKEKILNPKGLSLVERDACIAYLRDVQGLDITEIAAFLQMHRKSISLRLQKLENRRALELSMKGIDSFKLAIRLMGTTAFVKSKARENKDWRTYLDAEHRLIEKLQELGVIYKAPLKIDNCQAMFVQENRSNSKNS